SASQPQRVRSGELGVIAECKRACYRFESAGPEPEKLRDIAAKVRAVMQATPQMRTVNTDCGERVPVLHFSLDQDRLQTIGLTSTDVAQQLQFLLSGIPVTEVREDIRS